MTEAQQQLKEWHERLQAQARKFAYSFPYATMLDLLDAMRELNLAQDKFIAAANKVGREIDREYTPCGERIEVAP